MNRQSDPKTPEFPTSEDSEALAEGSSRITGRGRIILLAAGVLCFAVALAQYILRMDQTVGMFVDDAWYVLLGKAIATGHGFTMINSPSAGIAPFYPPGFPFILSLVFRIAPEFPQNLWLLKSVSVVAMMGVGIVCFLYFRYGREFPGYLALALAMATACTPPLVFLSASTVMSEPVFILAFMTVIALVEIGVRRAAPGRLWMYLVPASVVATFAFLTRSIAIAMIGGVILYLLKLRHIRGAVLFAAGCLICVSPWLIYSRAHAPTAEQRAEQSGYIVQDYATQFWQRKAGNARSGSVGVSDLPERVKENLGQMFTRDAGEMVAAKLYYLMQEGQSGYEAVSIVFALLIIAGYIAAVRERLTLAEIVTPATLVIVLLWPWETFRFVIPLTPFALLYLVYGFRSIFHLHLKMREQPRTPGYAGLTVLAVLVIALHLYGNFSYIVNARRSTGDARPGLMVAFEQNEEVMRWIKERLPEQAVIATMNPPLVHLYTGRKTVASDDPAKNWDTWNKLGVRYLAYISALPVTGADLAEGRYSLVYKPRGDLNLRVVDLGPTETRLRWGAAEPTRMQMIN